MSERRINDQILKSIENICKDDKQLNEFIKQLYYWETEHTGQSWWKNPYKDKINDFSSKWEKSNED